MTSQDKPKTVFGAPDQSEIISRLDAVEVDDDDSTYFDSRVGDADAAHRAFAEGISAFGGVEQGATPINDMPNDPTPTDSPSSGAMTPRVTAAEVSLPLEDPALRAAFILGGPAALMTTAPDRLSTSSPA